MQKFYYFSLICMAGSLFAETLTFQGALQEMKLQHPRLKAARSETEAARSRIGYADVLPNPSLTLGHFIESVQTRTGPQENVISLNQPFPAFGVRSAREQQAEVSTTYAARQEQAVALRLAEGLTNDFYEYAYLGKATRLTKENLRLLEGLEPVVETKVAAGKNLNALLRLNLEKERLSDQLRSLQARRVQVSSRLDTTLGKSKEEVRPWPQISSPSTNRLDLVHLKRQLFLNNATLLAQDGKISVAEAQERLAAKQGNPSIAVGASYIQLGEPVGNSSMTNSGEDPWSVHASIQIPLWRGAEAAKQKEATQLRQAEESRRNDLARSLQAELEQRVSLHNDALRKLEVYGETLLGLARQAVENSRAEYEAGNATLLELIDSERSLLAVELEYWRAVTNAHIQENLIKTLIYPDLETFINTK